MFPAIRKISGFLVLAAAATGQWWFAVIKDRIVDLIMRELGFSPDTVLTVGFLTMSALPIGLTGLAALIWWPEVKKAAALYFGPEYLPLPEAAKKLYQQGINESFGQTARAAGDSTDEILDFCANTIAKKIPVYGIRPLGVPELIPATDLQQGLISSGASVLLSPVNAYQPMYTDLAVRISDFRRQFRRFSGATSEWINRVPA